MKKTFVYGMCVLSALVVFTPTYASPVPQFSPYQVGEVTVYPIGWSPDGSLAILEFYDIGGPCGFCPRYHLRVISAVTDEVLDEIFFDEIIDESGDHAMTVEEVWDRHDREIERVLNRNRIDRDSPVPVSPLPIERSELTYSFTVEESRESREWWPYEAPVTVDVSAVESLSIYAHAEGLGQKRVYSYSGGDDHTIVTAMEPVAYMASPFEQRVALLVRRDYMGAETERNSVFLVGVHLTIGYR